MSALTRLVAIKIVHTIIWLFFNVVIFYMLYAVIVNKIDIWLGLGYAAVALEVFVLLLFKFYCPLTILARKYSTSTQPNFDIYLPNWLAKYNKLIYSGIMVVVILLTIKRLLA